MAEETKTTDAAQTEGVVQEKQEQADKPTATEAMQVNYEDVYSQDKALQSFVDKAVTKATQTAVANALQKQQRANDEKLSRSERLQAMSDAEKVKFLEEENRNLHGKFARDKEIESLKAQTTGMLTESGIPAVFLDVFNFESATAEDIKQRVAMLSEYEYYPKGEIDKRVTAGINEKLKQKQPETRTQDGGAKPPGMPQFF